MSENYKSLYILYINNEPIQYSENFDEVNRLADLINIVDEDAHAYVEDKWIPFSKLPEYM